MRIKETISELRGLKPNQYSDGMLVKWLSDLDGQIYENVMRNTEDAPPPPALPYKEEHDMETELLAPMPYAGVYIHYMAAQIDFHNGEYERYNNGMVMYNVALQEFADAWNRTHMHNQDGVIHV